MPDWNARYASGEHGEQAPIAIIERVARECRPGLALDLACGLGRHAICLAEHGWTVLAMDASEIAIGRLSDLTRRRGLAIQPVVQDLEAPDFLIEAERYDLICDCFYLHRALIPRIHAGVHSGGLAVLAIPLVDDTPGLKPMNREYLVRPGELRSWFQNWEIVDYKEEEEAAGRRKVAQLIARRPVSF